jgi:hypothetical protein
MPFQFSSHGHRSCCRLARTSRWRRTVSGLHGRSSRPGQHDDTLCRVHRMSTSLRMLSAANWDFYFGGDPASGAAGSMLVEPCWAPVVVPSCVGTGNRDTASRTRCRRALPQHCSVVRSALRDPAHASAKLYVGSRTQGNYLILGRGLIYYSLTTIASTEYGDLLPTHALTRGVIGCIRRFSGG